MSLIVKWKASNMVTNLFHNGTILLGLQPAGEEVEVTIQHTGEIKVQWLLLTIQNLILKVHIIGIIQTDFYGILEAGAESGDGMVMFQDGPFLPKIKLIQLNLNKVWEIRKMLEK